MEQIEQTGRRANFIRNNPLFEKAVIKGNKLILTGTLMGSKNKSKAFYQGKFWNGLFSFTIIKEYCIIEMAI